MISIQKLNSFNRIVVWGCGNSFINSYNGSLKISYLVDSDKKKQGTSVGGLDVLAPNALLSESADTTVIIICSIFYVDIIKEINHLGIKCRIVLPNDITPNPFLKNEFTMRAYSSFAEDAVIMGLSRRYQIPVRHYIDIGGNHPIIGNATYAFYEKYGATGVVVDPHTVFIDEYGKYRPLDSFLSAGIHDDDHEGKEAVFYEIPELNTRSTFSEVVANELMKNGFWVEKKTIPMRSLNSIIDEYEHHIDYISIDVETMEYTVLKDFDFCNKVEFFNIEKGDERVKNLLLSNGYELISETPGNWIFALEGLIRDIIPINRGVNNK